LRSSRAAFEIAPVADQQAARLERLHAAWRRPGRRLADEGSGEIPLAREALVPLGAFRADLVEAEQAVRHEEHEWQRVPRAGEVLSRRHRTGAEQRVETGPERLV